jgi:hypothetical protein
VKLGTVSEPLEEQLQVAAKHFPQIARDVGRRYFLTTAGEDD